MSICSVIAELDCRQSGKQILSSLSQTYADETLTLGWQKYRFFFYKIVRYNRSTAHLNHVKDNGRQRMAPKN